MELYNYELAVRKLYEYLLKIHWSGNFLVEPDLVGNIHWLAACFKRSYLLWLLSDNKYAYLQSQASGIMAMVYQMY